MPGNLHSGTGIGAAAMHQGNKRTFTLVKHFLIDPIHALHAPLVLCPCIEVVSLPIFSVIDNNSSVHKTSILRTIEGQAIRMDVRMDARMGVQQRWGDGAVTAARLEAR